jgi:hypothetical protein
MGSVRNGISVNAAGYVEIMAGGEGSLLIKRQYYGKGGDCWSG